MTRKQLKKYIRPADGNQRKHLEGNEMAVKITDCPI